MKTITVELPADLLQAADVSPSQANREVKQMLVLYLYARERISLGKACELLGISQWEFFELNKTWGLPMHYGEEEYRDDLRTLRQLPR